MPSLKAAPGRVVVRFPEVVTKIGAIIVPETSQVRPEFPLVHDLGAPLTGEDVILRRFFLDLMGLSLRSRLVRALPTFSRWLGLRVHPIRKVAISYMSGVSYWHPNYDPKEWGWLKAYRAYSYRELAAVLVEEDEAR